MICGFLAAWPFKSDQMLPREERSTALGSITKWSSRERERERE
jgi:hypothetical protein